MTTCLKCTILEKGDGTSSCWAESGLHESRSLFGSIPIWFGCTSGWPALGDRHDANSHQLILFWYHRLWNSSGLLHRVGPVGAVLVLPIGQIWNLALKACYLVPYSLGKGVLQGLILSPILLSIYIQLLAIQTTWLSCHQNADDTQFYFKFPTDSWEVVETVNT